MEPIVIDRLSVVVRLRIKVFFVPLFERRPVIVIDRAPVPFRLSALQSPAPLLVSVQLATVGEALIDMALPTPVVKMSSVPRTEGTPPFQLPAVVQFPAVVQDVVAAWTESVPNAIAETASRIRRRRRDLFITGMGLPITYRSASRLKAEAVNKKLTKTHSAKPRQFQASSPRMAGFPVVRNRRIRPQRRRVAPGPIGTPCALQTS